MLYYRHVCSTCGKVCTKRWTRAGLRSIRAERKTMRTLRKFGLTNKQQGIRTLRALLVREYARAVGAPMRLTLPLHTRLDLLWPTTQFAPRG